MSFSDVSSRFFHPVLPSKKLGRGPVRVTLAGQHYALFRDRSGRPAALVDRCPHRFAPLSRGRVRDDGRLACAYHGWSFDADGHGRRCHVAAMQVVERHDYVWIADPGVPSSRMPSLEALGYRFCGAAAVLFDAPLHVVLDNFSEDEHTPYVHTRLGWTERDVDYVNFSSESLEDRTTVHYDGPQRPSRMARLFGVRPGDIFHNDWVTRFDPVHIVYSIHWRDPSSGSVRPASIKSPIFFVPETEQTTWLHAFVWARLRNRLLEPLFAPVARMLATLEFKDDARFIGTVKDTPFDLKGMRLGKFDKPLVHNHKLLRSIYLAGDERRRLSVAGS